MDKNNKKIKLRKCRTGKWIGIGFLGLSLSMFPKEVSATDNNNWQANSIESIKNRISINQSEIKLIDGDTLWNLGMALNIKNPMILLEQNGIKLGQQYSLSTGMLIKWNGNHVVVFDKEDNIISSKIILDEEKVIPEEPIAFGYSEVPKQEEAEPLLNESDDTILMDNKSSTLLTQSDIHQQNSTDSSSLDEPLATENITIPHTNDTSLSTQETSDEAVILLPDTYEKEELDNIPNTYHPEINGTSNESLDTGEKKDAVETDAINNPNANIESEETTVSPIEQPDKSEVTTPTTDDIIDKPDKQIPETPNTESKIEEDKLVTIKKYAIEQILLLSHFTNDNKDYFSSLVNAQDSIDSVNEIMALAIKLNEQNLIIEAEKLNTFNQEKGTTSQQINQSSILPSTLKEELIQKLNSINTENELISFTNFIKETETTYFNSFKTSLTDIFELSHFLSVEQKNFYQTKLDSLTINDDIEQLKNEIEMTIRTQKIEEYKKQLESMPLVTINDNMDMVIQALENDPNTDMVMSTYRYLQNGWGTSGLIVSDHSNLIQSLSTGYTLNSEITEKILNKERYLKEIGTLTNTELYHSVIIALKTVSGDKVNQFLEELGDTEIDSKLETAWAILTPYMTKMYEGILDNETLEEINQTSSISEMYNKSFVPLKTKITNDVMTELEETSNLTDTEKSNILYELKNIKNISDGFYLLDKIRCLSEIKGTNIEDSVKLELLGDIQNAHNIMDVTYIFEKTNLLVDIMSSQKNIKKNIDLLQSEKQKIITELKYVHNKEKLMELNDHYQFLSTKRNLEKILFSNTELTNVMKDTLKQQLNNASNLEDLYSVSSEIIKYESTQSIQGYLDIKEFDGWITSQQKNDYLSLIDAQKEPDNTYDIEQKIKFDILYAHLKPRINQSINLIDSQKKDWLNLISETQQVYDLQKILDELNLMDTYKNTSNLIEEGKNLYDLQNEQTTELTLFVNNKQLINTYLFNDVKDKILAYAQYNEFKTNISNLENLSLEERNNLHSWLDIGFYNRDLYDLSSHLNRLSAFEDALEELNILESRYGLPQEGKLELSKWLEDNKYSDNIYEFSTQFNLTQSFYKLKKAIDLCPLIDEASKQALVREIKNTSNTSNFDTVSEKVFESWINQINQWGITGKLNESKKNYYLSKLSDNQNLDLLKQTAIELDKLISN